MEVALDHSPETSSGAMSIKRKADEAFDALDDALLPKDSHPSPPKRSNTSIYGALEKYGILSKPASPPKTTATPTLTALLSRARSRKNGTPLPVSQHMRITSAAPEYSPGSTDAFLNRLSTYNLSTYSSKPSQINAVAASKAGWINEGGKDRLYCSICNVGWVIAGQDGLSKDAANALVEKQRQLLIDMHKEGCPWRVRQCDSLVYRIPLQSPANLARQIKTCALEVEPVLDGILIRHPLSSIQVQTFIQTISSVPSGTNLSLSMVASAGTNGTTKHTTSNTSPSEISLLTSLFGWSLVPSAPLLLRKTSSASLVFARSHSRTSSGQSHVGFSRECTPPPGAVTILPSFNTPNGPTTPLGTHMNGTENGVHPSTTVTSTSPLSPPGERPQQNDAMLQCRMCQRRIGLWAFAASKPSSSSSPADDSSASSPQSISNRPQRPLDLLREHRSYCPYVVKSTPLLSLPSYPPPSTSSSSDSRLSFILSRTGTSSSTESQNATSAFNLPRPTLSLFSGMSSPARTGTLSSSAVPTASEPRGHNLVEGWRAVYNTVLRFGMSERSRARMHIQPSTGSTPQTSPGSNSVATEHGNSEDDVMGNVIELVEGVKRHGGKQLLSYVRSLLG